MIPVELKIGGVAVSTPPTSSRSRTRHPVNASRASSRVSVRRTYTHLVTEVPSDDSLDRPLADAERIALLALPLPGVFSTVAPDGSVHSVPIHFVFIDDEIRFIAESDSVKVRNARRTGRATLCVTTTVDEERRYVTVEGPVRIEDGLVQADLEALDHRYGRDSGSAADEEYADTVTLVVRPERWLGRADSD